MDPVLGAVLGVYLAIAAFVGWAAVVVISETDPRPGRVVTFAAAAVVGLLWLPGVAFVLFMVITD